MTDDVRDFLEGLTGGGRSAFPQDCPIGTTVRGRVVAARKEQQTSLDGALRTFPSGQPMHQLVVDVETDERDDDDDDGVRRLYAKGGNFTPDQGSGTSMAIAIRDALKEAGIEMLVGSDLAIRKTGIGKRTKPGLSPPSLYTAKVTPAPNVTVTPSTSALLDDL
jgi:hypothetical protein